MAKLDTEKFHARYSLVERRLWNDLRGLSPIQPCGVGLWFYLLSTPKLGVMPGLICEGEAALAEHLRWPIKGFRDAFFELYTQGMVIADWTARLVVTPKVIRNMILRGGPESPNVIRGWATQWIEVPDCPLKTYYYNVMLSGLKSLGESYENAFYEACQAPASKGMGDPFAKGMDEGMPNGLDEGMSKGRGNQIQIQIQTQKIPPTPRRAARREAGGEPKAHERYAQAYADGVRAACGADFPRPRGKAALIDMALAYANGAVPGEKLTGDALLAWFRETARAFRLAVPGQFWKGYSPDGCLLWLNAGRPTQAQRVVNGRSHVQQPAEANPFWTAQTPEPL